MYEAFKRTNIELDKPNTKKIKVGLQDNPETVRIRQKSYAFPFGLSYWWHELSHEERSENASQSHNTKAHTIFVSFPLSGNFRVGYCFVSKDAIKSPKFLWGNYYLLPVWYIGIGRFPAAGQLRREGVLATETEQQNMSGTKKPGQVPDVITLNTEITLHQSLTLSLFTHIKSPAILFCLKAFPSAWMPFFPLNMKYLIIHKCSKVFLNKASADLRGQVPCYTFLISHTFPL